MSGIEFGHLLATSCRPTLRGIFSKCQDVALKTSINFDINLHIQGLQQVWACVLLLHVYCHYLEMIRAQCLIQIGQHFLVFDIIKKIFKCLIKNSPPLPQKRKLQNDVLWTKLINESSLRMLLHCLQLFNSVYVGYEI